MTKRLALSFGLAALICSTTATLSHAGTLTYTFRTVNFPGDTFTQLLGINNSGTIAGYYGATINEGFTLTLPSNFVLEDVVPSTNTQVVGINNKGETVGFFVDASGVAHYMEAGNTFGFFYNIASGKYQEVNDPLGLKSTTINGINDPEPASLLLIGTGLLALAGLLVKLRKRRNNRQLS